VCLPQNALNKAAEKGDLLRKIQRIATANPEELDREKLQLTTVGVLEKRLMIWWQES